MSKILAPLWSGETPDKISKPTPEDLDISARYYDAAQDSQHYVANKIGLGTVAFCSQGCLGLILFNEQREVTYTQPVASQAIKHGHVAGEFCEACFRLQQPGKGLGISDYADFMESYKKNLKAFAWTGIHLTDKTGRLGGPWSSRDPRPVARIEIHEALTCLTIAGTGTFWWNAESK